MLSTIKRWCLLGVLAQAALSPAWSQSNDNREDEQQIRRLGDLNPEVEEWTPGQGFIEQEADSLDRVRQEAEQALAAGRLAGDDGAVALWQQVLDQTSNDERALEALDTARQRWLVAINRQLNEPDRSALLAEQRQLQELADVAALDAVRQAVQTALSWLNQRPSLANANTPDGWQEAREQVQAMLEQAGELDWLLDDREQLRQIMLEQWQKREQATTETIGAWVRAAQDYGIELPNMQAVTARLEQQRLDTGFARVEQAISAWQLQEASARLNDLPDSDPRHRELQERLQNARRWADVQIGEAIDLDLAPPAPFMVMVARQPDGSLLFAGKTEVTRAQYFAYLYATETTASTIESERFSFREGSLVADGATARQDYLGAGSESPEHPVIHLRWQDAMGYISWLNEQSEVLTFRLPTTSEFQAYAGAGIDGRFWWGDGAPFQALENLAGWNDLSPRRQLHSSAFSDYGDNAFGPTKVAQYRANPLGLHDTLGNVAEWGQPCADGTKNNCRGHMALGSHWQSGPTTEGKRAQLILPAERGSSRVGLRVVAELRP